MNGLTGFGKNGGEKSRPAFKAVEINAKEYSAPQNNKSHLCDCVYGAHFYLKKVTSLLGVLAGIFTAFNILSCAGRKQAAAPSPAEVMIRAVNDTLQFQGDPK